MSVILEVPPTIDTFLMAPSFFSLERHLDTFGEEKSGCFTTSNPDLKILSLIPGESQEYLYLHYPLFNQGSNRWEESGSVLPISAPTFLRYSEALILAYPIPRSIDVLSRVWAPPNISLAEASQNPRITLSYDIARVTESIRILPGFDYTLGSSPYDGIQIQLPHVLPTHLTLKQEGDGLRIRSGAGSFRLLNGEVVSEQLVRNCVRILLEPINLPLQISFAPDIHFC